MAKTKNQPVGEKRRAPEWVQNIKDFFKMVFVSPFALLARIAQRIALGKEGAQKADEMAEAAYKASNERRAAEKVANHMNKEIDNILKQKNQNQEYCENPLNIKACKIYIPDNGRNDLQFAIDVHCQNQTEYNHSRDFALYVDKDGELVCNKGVPTEIVKQVEALLDQIKLVQRGAETDVRAEIDTPQNEEPIQVNPTVNDAQEADNHTNQMPPNKLEPQTLEDGKITLSRGDVSVDAIMQPDGVAAVLYSTGDKEYLMKATYKNYAISIDCADPKVLAKIPHDDYGLLQSVLSTAFGDAIKNDSKEFNGLDGNGEIHPLNGVTCEEIVKNLTKESKTMPLDGTYRIYIIPNHFTENDVVMKVESNISKKDNGLVHNFFVRSGYMNSHNAFVQYEVDEGVSISSKTQTPAKIRELAANYMYAAGYRAGAVLEGATSQNNRKTVYPMYDYANQCHAASIEWQHGALIVRGEAPIDYHILSEYAKYRSGQIEIEDERNNALNKIAEKITQSNPSYIYGIIDNVIVECNKNQIVGHMLGCPQYTFTASFENKSDARDVLETVTQHLESQMKAYANESPDIIKQNETDDLEYNDDFEEVI